MGSGGCSGISDYEEKGVPYGKYNDFFALIAILEIIKYIKKIVAHSVKMCDYKNNFCRIRFEGTVKATLCILIITH